VGEFDVDRTIDSLEARLAQQQNSR
jgi:hypothetical protein